MFYMLGYLHGMRYYHNRMHGVSYSDTEPEKTFIDALPVEVSSLRLGADPEPAFEKINALMSARKHSQNNTPTEERPRPNFE